MARRGSRATQSPANESPEPTEGTAGSQTTETSIPEGEPTSQRRTGQRTRQPAKRGRTAGRQQRAGKSETAAVVEALLTTRGSKGATQEDLERAVSWAQQVQTEGEAIDRESVPRRNPRNAAKTSPRAKAAQQRQREQQEELLRERRRRFEMDRALLDGVVAGRIRLDVQDGQLLFLSAEQIAAPAAGAARVGEIPAPNAY